MENKSQRWSAVLATCVKSQDLAFTGKVPIVTEEPRACSLADALSHHRVGKLQEPRDISTEDKVASVAIFFCRAA